MLREDIKAATITAMKAGDKPRTAALRLIAARIKDRDIELRTSTKEIADDDLVTEVLQKMAKQRRESIQMFAQGGRDELAAQEQAELDASGVKDMGRVMGELKARHGSQLDMGRASALVKAALS